MTFDAYHATDQNNAVLIQYEGFKFHHNDEHWLGNGVYFFIDEALAKKWVEKQYFIFSDEFLKPFGVYNITFGYTIAGKYKG